MDAELHLNVVGKNVLKNDDIWKILGNGLDFKRGFEFGKQAFLIRSQFSWLLVTVVDSGWRFKNLQVRAVKNEKLVDPMRSKKDTGRFRQHFTKKAENS